MQDKNQARHSNAEQLINADRPKSVTTSIRLLVAVVLIGLFQFGIVILRHIDVRDPTVMLATKSALLAASMFLLYRLYNGAGWARVLLVVILLFAVPLTVLPTLQSFSVYPFFASLELVQFVFYLIALGLLFRKESSAWFSGNR